LIMEAGGTNLGSAYMEAQTLPTITDTTLAGSYEWGTLAPLASFIQDDIGEYTLGSLTSLTAAGSFTGTSTSGQQYEFSWDSPFSSATYAEFDGSGHVPHPTQLAGSELYLRY